MSMKFIELHFITHKNRTEELKVASIINTAHIDTVLKTGENAIITFESGETIHPLECYDDIRRMLCGDS